MAAIFAAAVLPFVWAQPAAAAVSPVRWCGNDALQTDRVPERVASYQFHVVYAIPSNGGDRFNEVASAIATDLGAIDSWWRAQDPNRAPRWDLFAFPGCDSRLGALDISFVRLPRPAEYYDVQNAQRVAQQLYTDLIAAPRSFSHKAKKYVVFYDGPARKMDACGLGSAAGYAFMFLLPPDGCPPVDVGAGRFTAMVTAHEMVHALGGVARGAPHPCPNDPGHTCDDERDIIHGVPKDVPLEARLLDPGHDDYYAHAGPWFDLQDSPWLSNLHAKLFALELSVKGEEGKVAADLPGVDCPRACEASFEAGTRITLTPISAQGTRFSGWSGACGGRLPKCTLTIDAKKNVTASFAKGTGGPGPGGDDKENAVPTASFSLRQTTYETGKTIRFISTSTDRDGSIKSLKWVFGDGTSATGRFVTHVYKRQGRYTVKLIVTDDKGAAGETAKVLTLTNPPPLVEALPAFARRGTQARLGFLIRDNSAINLVKVEVLRGKSVLARITLRTPSTDSYRHATWRAPNARARLNWCVRVWDDGGKASPRQCAALRVL